MMLPNPRMAILLIILYVAHFFLARWITIKLIERGFIQRDSPEFKKAVLFWFTPIVGALGLWFLFLVNKFLLWWKWFNKWIKLSHYIPEPAPVTYNEEEILQRVELIKEKERLEILAKKRKKVKK